MRWYRAPTYGREQVGVDETRKPVTELRPTGESHPGANRANEATGIRGGG